MITVFLGAGFSKVGGVPLASELFDARPEVDRITRQRLVERVVSRWEQWHSSTGGVPEEYLAFLESRGGHAWRDAVWFVGLVITLRVGRVELVGPQPTVVRHNVDRTTQIPVHEEFWSTIFRRTDEVAVITTNYEILPERGLRHEPRPRVPRPGFNYGNGPEPLAGGGYPSYAHIRKIATLGSVPLLKLHGSVSWSVRDQALVRYHDCRPAIRGDAAILAPVTDKSVPPYLRPTWEQASDCLANSGMWLVVGYSPPAYDEAVRELLSGSADHGPSVHVFDPREEAVAGYVSLLPKASVERHPGLPEGLADLRILLGPRGD